MQNLVRLKCVSEYGRLRVKILTPSYHPDANCQFPRDIRVEGREYLVPAQDINFSEMRCKFFYRVKRDNIQIVDVDDIGTNVITPIKIYGDGELTDCCICLTGLTDDPSMVFVAFAPCGHYCCCRTCASQLKLCPLCREPIHRCVTKDQLQ
jgi:hypothetical protein